MESLAQHEPLPKLLSAPAVFCALNLGPSTVDEAVQQAKHQRNTKKKRSYLEKEEGLMKLP